MYRVQDYLVDIVTVRYNNECWEWPNAKSSGRGVLRFNGRKEYAYRAAYIVRYGSIPRGYDLHHTCWKEWCWNPKHMLPCIHSVNMLSGPANSLSTCRHGHDLSTPDKVRYRKNGKRNCRECDREYQRKKARILQAKIRRPLNVR